MGIHDLENFDLLIEPTGTGYQARVPASPVGEVRPVPVTIPSSREALAELRVKIGSPYRVSPSETTSREAAGRDIGARLFDAVFPDDLRRALRESLVRTNDNFTGLRLRLRLPDSSELADLPWELLYDDERRSFLALSLSTTIVRWVELAHRIESLTIDPPLRILVLAASPGDLGPMDVDGEWQRIEDATHDLIWFGRVTVDRMHVGTPTSLRAHLRRSDYNVLHFIGHGHNDPLMKDGVLALEGADGRAHLMSGSDLGALLHDHDSIRLAVLSSGASDPDGPESFSGTAASLVRAGIPAVVAVQSPMSDRAASSFTYEFYRAIAEFLPIDDALTAARRAVSRGPIPLEWAAPVLYLGGPDARLFDVRPMVMGGGGSSRREPAGWGSPRVVRSWEVPPRPPRQTTPPASESPPTARAEPPPAPAPEPRDAQKASMPPAAAAPPPPPAREQAARPRRQKSKGPSRGRAPEDPYGSAALQEAVQKVLTPGRLLFNPPDDMRQGTVERVEVAIARTADLDDELRAGLRGRGVARIENLDTSPFMSVDLRGTGFEITPLSLPAGMDQLVHPTARWEFDVLPRRSGTRTLQVLAWMRVPLADGSEGRRSVPVFERTVQVRVAPLYATKTFAATNWQWLVATSVAAGGGVAAWIKLVG